MSIRIERIERRHLNVKNQDRWRLRVAEMELDAGSIELTMRDANEAVIGKLFLNGISLEALEDLRDKIDNFIKAQRVVLEEHRQRMGEPFFPYEPPPSS